LRKRRRRVKVAPGLFLATLPLRGLRGRLARILRHEEKGANSLPAIDIIFTACLIASPARCETVRIEQATYGTPYQCAMKAQQQIALYMRDHEAWYIKSFGCGRRSKDA
jgi:hypothetical protein